MERVPWTHRSCHMCLTSRLVLLQVGSVQAKPFWLVLNDGGLPVKQTHDFLTTCKQVWLDSQAQAEFHCITLVREMEALSCAGVAAIKHCKTWQNSLHGISMMETKDCQHMLFQTHAVPSSG